ncbi:MAG: hypothetical protein ACK5XZ_02675 [Hyphomonadaceae bacterium]|jgi:hypothetical protein|nr:hypothetical protein [Aquidulcibacter sp.]
MSSSFSGMVTSSQTREEAFGSMSTIQAITNKATKMPIFSKDHRILVLALVSLGGVLIALGPWLSGTPQSLGTWCHHAASFGAQFSIQDLIWMANQHCSYCYLGAAMIGIGIATGLLRPPKRHASAAT